MDEPKGYSPVNGQPVPEGKPFTTGDERAKLAGLASAAARARKKTMRDELTSLLDEKVRDKTGKEQTVQYAISSALIKKALDGSVKAYELIRDTIGEKPIEKIMLAEVEQSVIDEVEAAVLNDTATGG